MKRLIISGLVAIALLAVATTLRSHSRISADHSHVTDSTLKKSPALTGINTLPIEEYEDMTFVFSTPAKH
jgi:hypothetical protein